MFGPIILWVVATAIIIYFAKRIPLTGTRKLVVVICRIAALSILCAALLNYSREILTKQPQHVVYLVDVSHSIDEDQLAWIVRRINWMETIRPDQVNKAVMAFGSHAQLLESFSTDRLTDSQGLLDKLKSVRIEGDKTNLEDGLLSALGLLPSGQGIHVVLWSDGWETIGDTATMLNHLRRLGVSIFPEPVPVSENLTITWQRLLVPPLAQRDLNINMQLVFSNDSQKSKSAMIDVKLAGISIKQEAVSIHPGWQVISVSVPAIAQGAMVLEVEVMIPEEGWQEKRMTYTQVEGPPHVLLVDDEPTELPLLAQALKRQGFDFSLARPGDLPESAVELTDYDVVMLYNIPKSSVTISQKNALKEYLENFGGGLVMVGMGGDLSYEISNDSPLDELLPVSYEAKGLQESNRRVCMIMLIDRSASMIGPRIAATKRAAVELVNQLSPEDLVGVLAFDTKPYVIVEVQQARQVGKRLIEKLVKLRSSGGTNIYPALQIAKERLEQTDATLKHIILLSDGNTPFSKEVYDHLTKQFRDDQVSISTIAIGAAFVNTGFLKYLSEATGGTFYQLRSLNELPQLIAHDTQKALGRLPYTEGYFPPERHEASEWFGDIYSWPVLRGFLTTSEKPSASVDLIVSVDEEVSPLLARWSLGKGRVVVFTSDADARWSPEWIRWPQFDGVWTQVFRWVMRSRFSETMFVWVDEQHHPSQLMIEGELSDPHATLTTPNGASSWPVALIKTENWQWSASLEQFPSGWYELDIESKTTASDGSSGSVFAKRWIQIGTAPVIEERQHQPPRIELLHTIAEQTDGLYGFPDSAFLPPMTTSTERQPLALWFLPFVILFLLIDVAIRGATML